MTTKKLTKLLALYLPYILLGLVATNFGEAWRLAEGKELGDKIMSMVGTLPLAFANPLPSLHPLDLLIGFFCGAGLRLAVYLRSKNAKKYRHGMEYGSARWGTPKDIEPFQAPKFADNIILTKTERLMMSNRPPDPKNARNKNVLVVGGSGSGKTRFWLKPNLLQCHSSYVVTDPKGSIVVECGNALLKNGYKVRILNTINFKKSMHYNPFAYVHSEKDILKLVTTLMTNTKGEGSGGDPFWEKSERLLLTALIAYLHYEAPVEEQNFATLLEMLNTMQVLEDDEEYQNPVDLLFEELAKKKPNSFAGRQYKLYKLAAGKTAKSILISCGARLAPFDIQELRDLTMYDELQLDTLGDKKTALFLIMSDTDLINGAVETECPQLRIIEPELFEQAQELRQARTCERGGTSLGTSSKALLTGLVYCGHCGNRLSLTSSGRTHTYADGHMVKEVRPRYSCFYKIRHPGDCDGQSGYGVSKLDSIVEEVVRQIFAQFREVSRKKLLESVKTNDAARIQKKVKKIQKDLESKQKELDDLKAETILVIRGVSALDKELLGTLVAEAREALETLEKQLVQAQEEYEEATKTAKRSNYICNELFTWADVYDTANHDERRAILQQFIKEIRVRKDYEISITLNASFNQVEQLKAVSTYDGAEIFEGISEKGA